MGVPNETAKIVDATNPQYGVSIGSTSNVLLIAAGRADNSESSFAILSAKEATKLMAVIANWLESQ